MMDFLEPLEHIFVIITSIITAASTVTAVTDTPNKDNSLMHYLYRLIELLALVTEKTKQKQL